jgi:Fe2+ transport system protein FeoA
MEKSLIELKEGQKGIITRISGGFGMGHKSHGGGHHAVKQLENLGIRIRKEVTVTSIQPFGPIVIEIDGRETAIGKGRAAKIYVEV